MPLPLFLLIPIAIGGIAGSFNAISGICKGKEADDIIDLEGYLNDQAYEGYRKEIKHCNDLFEQFTEQKVKCHENIVVFVKMLNCFQKVEYIPNDISSLSVEDKNMVFKSHTLGELAVTGDDILGAVKAISSGAAAGKGALLLTGVFGKASTGTAISALKGAAATKATYAALGGGALKAGGLGIIGGNMVLGGIIAAPTLLIGGIMLNIHGEKKLTSACEFEAASEEYRAILNNEIEVIRAIETRVIELKQTINSLHKVMIKILKKLEQLADEIIDYHNQTSGIKYNMQEKDYSLIKNAVLVAKSLKELLIVPVFDEDGKLSEKSKRYIRKGDNVLNTLNEEV